MPSKKCSGDHEPAGPTAKPLPSHGTPSPREHQANGWDGPLLVFYTVLWFFPIAFAVWLSWLRWPDSSVRQNLEITVVGWHEEVPYALLDVTIKNKGPLPVTGLELSCATSTDLKMTYVRRQGTKLRRRPIHSNKKAIPQVIPPGGELALRGFHMFLHARTPSTRFNDYRSPETTGKVFCRITRATAIQAGGG